MGKVLEEDHAKRYFDIGMVGSGRLDASAVAEDAKTTYPAMAPVGQYMMSSAADEVALARSAAPPSIADEAEVLTLGSHGYETAAQGKNGSFAWFGGLGRPA